MINTKTFECAKCMHKKICKYIDDDFIIETRDILSNIKRKDYDIKGEIFNLTFNCPNFENIKVIR